MFPFESRFSTTPRGHTMHYVDEVTAEGFIDSFADACRTSGPYMEFLTRAVGLPY